MCALAAWAFVGSLSTGAAAGPPVLASPAAGEGGPGWAEGDDELGEGLGAPGVPGPTADPRGSARAPAKPRWVKERVVGGDRLDELADRHGVTREQIVKWNRLDPKRPRIRAGQELKIYTADPAPPRERITYVVQPGDTWKKIAERHGVAVDRLELWNREVPRKFKAGASLVIWVEAPRGPAADELAEGQLVPVADRREGTSAAGTVGKAQRLGAAGAAASLEPRSLESMIKPVRDVARSVGRPNRGRITNAIRLPENPALYVVRNPDEAWGASHTILHLQLAIAKFRRDYRVYAGEVVIGDLSKRGGGRLRPHSSHQSGRDVDIRMLTKPGVTGPPQSADQIDFDATWALVQALLETGQVESIYVDHGRQKHLRAAAKRAGVSAARLDEWFQYPSPPKTTRAPIRHEPGHVAHFHVRFRCGPKDLDCSSR